jgi:hypothetical protein
VVRDHAFLTLLRLAGLFLLMMVGFGVLAFVALLLAEVFRP